MHDLVAYHYDQHNLKLSVLLIANADPVRPLNGKVPRVMQPVNSPEPAGLGGRK